ncbi:MAG: HAD-IIB family hydrolase [Lachnospiraceae bacterium]|nr:HAD-IIB family hydrolase [Lachnospiraceae bacterium]
MTGVKMLLFDLDETLLASDKKIPKGALRVLREYREAGVRIGVSTSRGAGNTAQYVRQLHPDVIIASGGAQLLIDGRTEFASVVEAAKIRSLIRRAQSIAGEEILITADAADGSYYLNFTPPDDDLARSFRRGRKITFRCFRKDALKVCLEIPDEAKAKQVIAEFPELDSIRFSDGYWYKFTNRGITKEHTIAIMCERLGISPADITAFGDDLADIGMLRLCGRGIAMGNAQDEVKRAADEVIGTNNDRGVEIFLRTERVRAMEELFDRAKAGKASPSERAALENYLNNGFLGDYEADEAGLLPADLKRGVLSQDALYDYLSEEG